MRASVGRTSLSIRAGRTTVAVVLTFVCGCSSEVLIVAPPTGYQLPGSDEPVAEPRPALLIHAATRQAADSVVVVFSTNLAPMSVLPEAFTLTTANGSRLVPKTVTLAPASELDEHRTVTLSGFVVPPEDNVANVAVTAGLHDVYGHDLEGLSATIAPESEPLRAIRVEFLPPTGDRCSGQPLGLRAYWNLALDGVQSEDLTGIVLRLADGSETTPVRFDDEEQGPHADNVLDLCLRTTSPVVSVSIASKLFVDARGRPNVAAVFEGLEPPPVSPTPAVVGRER